MYVLLPVPEAKQEAVMRLQLDQDQEGVTDHVAEPIAPTGSWRDRLDEHSPEHAEMSDEDVRQAYRASVTDSPKRQLLLDHLSEHPDEVLSYGGISSALGWGRRSLPGVISAMLRAAGTRFDHQRPVRIYQDVAGVWFMKMDERVAELIRDEASKVKEAHAEH